MKATVLNLMRAISLLLNYDFHVFLCFIPISNSLAMIYPFVRLSSQLGKLPQEMARALVSARVVVKVLLVVRLGVPPLSGL